MKGVFSFKNFWKFFIFILNYKYETYTLNTAVATPKVSLGTIDEYPCPREVRGGLDFLWLRAI